MTKNARAVFDYGRLTLIANPLTPRLSGAAPIPIIRCWSWRWGGVGAGRLKSYCVNAESDHKLKALVEEQKQAEVRPAL